MAIYKRKHTWRSRGSLNRRVAARRIQRWARANAGRAKRRSSAIARPMSSKRFKGMEPRLVLNQTAIEYESLPWNSLKFLDMLQIVGDRSAAGGSQYNFSRRGYVDINGIKLEFHIENLYASACLFNYAILCPKYQSALTTADINANFFQQAAEGGSFNASDFDDTRYDASVQWKNIAAINSQRFFIYTRKKLILPINTALGGGVCTRPELSHRTGYISYGMHRQYIPIKRRFYRNDGAAAGTGEIPLLLVYWISPLAQATDVEAAAASNAEFRYRIKVFRKGDDN